MSNTDTTLNKRIFAILFLSVFTAITGVGIVVPLLPVYAHNLGASGLYISMIFGAFAFSRTILLPYIGPLSDKKGRKPFIVWGLFVYALVSLAYMYTDNITTLIGIRVFQGLASAAIMPVTQAYIGDLTPRGKEGFTMGLFNLSMYGSFSLGPLIGGYLNDHHGIRYAFLFMGILSLTGFLLSLIMLPPVSEESFNPNQRDKISIIGLLKQKTLFSLFSFRTAYTACIGVIWSFLPVYADTQFQLSSTEIGFVVMLGVLTAGLLQTPMGYLADRFNRVVMISAGGIIVTASMLYLYYADGFQSLIAGNLLFGLGGGICIPALMAIATIEGKRTGHMASVMTILTLGHSVGMLAGSGISGLMMDHASLRSGFLAAACIMTSGLLIFLILIKKSGRYTQTTL